MPDDDSALTARMAAGDRSALDRLMARYDALVRFTIFRVCKEQCRRDPQWMDSVAGSVWMGFIRSMQRDPQKVPKSLSAYLIQVARNQSISAIRQSALAPNVETDSELSLLQLESGEQALSDLAEEAESLLRLRRCLESHKNELGVLFSQFQAIVDRRWQQAADVLGCSESTLRSRWVRALESLRECMASKTGGDFAPDGKRNDS